jgi:glycosyltransferase involved in cell wall biosynthesis
MYNENAAIPIFLKRVRAVMESSLGKSYEIVCVNDGSTDETLSQLIEAQKTDARLKVIDLSLNFGKEVALTAGIDHASGKAVIPIDANLQDPPEIIGEMVNK